MLKILGRRLVVRVKASVFRANLMCRVPGFEFGLNSKPETQTERRREMKERWLGEKDTDNEDERVVNKEGEGEGHWDWKRDREGLKMQRQRQRQKQRQRQRQR